MYLLVDVFGWFEFGTMKGGSLGLYIDKHWLKYNVQTLWKRRAEELRNHLGIVLPKLDIRDGPSAKEKPSPFSTLAESLTRTFSNIQNRSKAESAAKKWRDGCEKESEYSYRSNIPLWILQPNEAEWFRPLTGTNNLMVLDFDESDMRRLIRDEFEELLPKYDAAATATERVHLWTACALYWYGGFIFGPKVREVSSLIKDVSTSVGPPCGDQAVAIFGKTNKHTNDEASLVMFASSPRHPHLLCLIMKMSLSKDPLDALQVLSMIFGGDGWSNSIARSAVDNESKESKQTWEWAMLGIDFINKEISCNEPSRRLSQAISFKGWQGVSLLGLSVKNESPTPPTTVEVRVSEAVASEVTMNTTKLSRRTSLVREGCFPSWLCNRCLRNLPYGTFKSCSSWCISCYTKNQCVQSDRSMKKKIQVQVSVRRKSTSSASSPIPRIVHQTSPEIMTTKYYPELTRIQNSWRNSGFEYRFYNDTASRDYIVKNFPHRFVATYDSLLPGAYQVS